MPKFFPQVFITGVVLFLLLGAGYGIATLQARSIPWDCADWQAFANDDRTTSILESLAENRGKTLYCGVDQSDTFTKTETWEAGKDRNERDDTVYFGERGSFRGFIAAQEGWLTDGESGITGISIDRIFEFPREKKKRRRKKPLPKPNLVYDRQYNADNDHYRGGYQNFCAGGNPGRRTTSNAFVLAWGPAGARNTSGDRPAAEASARAAFERSVTRSQTKAWARRGRGDSNPIIFCEEPTGASGECEDLPDENGEMTYTGTPRIIEWWLGDTWTYATVLPSVPGEYQHYARRFIYYTAYCR